MDSKIKFYRFKVQGEIQWENEAGKIPKVDKDGNIVVVWAKITAPPTALIQQGANLRSNPWFQCEAVELLNEATSITPAGGKSYEIGPMEKKATPINIFYNTHKDVYEAIYEKIVTKKFIVITSPEAAKEKGIAPVIEIDNWALPGLAKEFETGFRYKVMTRRKKTHELVQLEASAYNDKGEPIKIPITKTRARIFLFADQVDAMEAHIKDMIANLAKFKVVEEGPTARRDEAVKEEGDDTDAAPII